MGLNIGVSRCRTGDTVYVPAPNNPDPKNFRISHHKVVGQFLLVEVVYPNCTTFEGRKILVYKDVPFSTLQSQTEIDPHFCEDTNHISPVSRFRPGIEGWAHATLFAKVASS